MGKALRGVAFDLDGTLLDTETLYRRFWVMAARQMGYPMEEKHALMIRSLAAEYAQPLLRQVVCPDFDYAAVRTLRRTLMEKYIDEQGVIPKPGLIQTLDALRDRGLRMTLATATPQARARKYLRMVGAEDYFYAVVCADMVAHGKPAPDIYLLAAERMGLAPQETMAVEDSPMGVHSAHAAGMFTVMIPDQDQPDEATRALCDAVVPTLFDLIELTKTKMTNPNA